eukprot:CAMPEP_0174243944 /NCGR_PEP_ID=MMETSP0417-20130205/33457_1 /TAXON_ID=242541 /ORGANISM="Mayorella sp, Strain BSH-02190019" /LENGTH=232 /DNA_ID=CAMNT_0015323549 /DNA_START=78 /DNA_END=776 /DNA_ORIENTATION=+
MKAQQFGNTPRPGKVESSFIAGMNALEAKDLQTAEKKLTVAVEAGMEQAKSSPTSANKEALAISLAGLGFVYLHKNELDKSEALYAKSLEAWEAIHGTDSLKTVPLQADIASLQAHQGRYDAAIATWKAIQAKFEARAGGECGDSISVYCSIALVHARAGRLEEAEKQFDEAISKLEAIKSRSIVNALQAQESFYRDLGNTERADAIKASAEEKREKFAARRRSTGKRSTEK